MGVYLDCNATHPILSSVKTGLSRALLADDPALFNSASIHRVGQGAKKIVAELKALLAQSLGRVEADEWILMSGATEGLNLAIRGFVESRHDSKLCLVASAVEHSAILDTVADVEKKNPERVSTLILNVDAEGQLDVDTVLELLRRKISDGFEVLLCLQLANNETGIAFDAPALLQKIYNELGPRLPLGPLSFHQKKTFVERPQKIWVLLDAAQALGKMDPLYIRRSFHFVDFGVFSAHKIGAPSGMGALWLRPQSPFAPQITGGSQERKRRAGTLNSVGVLGFKLALQDWIGKGAFYRERMQRQKERIFEVLGKIPGVHFHGRSSLPNTLNFHVEGCPEESLLLALDLEGIYLSSGSACHSGSLKASHVLKAMAYSDESTLSSLRVCVGAETSDQEIEVFLKAISEKIEHIRKARKAAAELLPDMDDNGVAPQALTR